MNVTSSCIVSPEQSPLRWAVINAICFLASVALFIDILIAEIDLSERLIARAGYLIWNFGTTVVWLSEVAPTIQYSYPVLKWEHCVETLLAVYFTVDSFHLLYKWKIKKQDIEEELWDVAINAIVYAFAFARVFSIYKRSKRESFQKEGGIASESTGLVA